MSKLTLVRKQNQSVAIPGLGITINVKHIGTTRVTLEIEAPEDVRILRGELTERHWIESLQRQFNEGKCTLGQIDKSLQFGYSCMPEVLGVSKFKRHANAFQEITGQDYDAYRRSVASSPRDMPQEESRPTPDELVQQAEPHHIAEVDALISHFGWDLTPSERRSMILMAMFDNSNYDQ